MMSMPARASSTVDAEDVVARLGALCRGQGLDGLAERMAALAALGADDLRAVEAMLASLPRWRGTVADSALHLVRLGGKRLRPLCVALAARLGVGFGAAARELAVAVELVHSATLLHDDVVDLGDVRRGAATARSLFGNAASIFAGDWLLTEALARVVHASVPGTLEALLAVIQEMIRAESTQLENRGRLVADLRVWRDIVVGKTASLFRWALDAGARAGGLADDHRRALGAYGTHLGVAFQAVDDLLDLTGSAAATGKALFADLREGKMTWPLIVALEREPSLGACVAEALALPPERPLPEALCDDVVATVARTGAADDCRRFARAEAAAAIACIDGLPACEARAALETVSAAAVERVR